MCCSGALYISGWTLRSNGFWLWTLITPQTFWSPIFYILLPNSQKSCSVKFNMTGIVIRIKIIKFKIIVFFLQVIPSNALIIWWQINSPITVNRCTLKVLCIIIMLFRIVHIRVKAIHVERMTTQSCCFRYSYWFAWH